MNNWKRFSFALLVFAISSACLAQQGGMAKPELILREQVQGMSRGEKQEVRVLTASFKPGDKTVFHTHRFPVTVYVLEGRAPITVKAGQALVEPPNVKMTGYNRSSTDPLRVVIFYTSDSGTPFLDPVR